MDTFEESFEFEDEIEIEEIKLEPEDPVETSEEIQEDELSIPAAQSQISDSNRAQQEESSIVKKEKVLDYSGEIIEISDDDDDDYEGDPDPTNSEIDNRENRPPGETFSSEDEDSLSHSSEDPDFIPEMEDAPQEEHVFKKKKRKVGRPPGTKQKADFQCVFCSESFTGIQKLTNHSVYCRAIRALEPKIQCQYCSQKLAVSQAFGLVHDYFCKTNPRAFQSKVTVDCPACSTNVLSKTFNLHLASCLEHLNIATRISILASTRDKSIDQKLAPALFRDKIGKSKIVQGQLQSKKVIPERRSKAPPAPSEQVSASINEFLNGGQVPKAKPDVASFMAKAQVCLRPLPTKTLEQSTSFKLPPPLPIPGGEKSEKPSTAKIRPPSGVCVRASFHHNNDTTTRTQTQPPGQVHPLETPQTSTAKKPFWLKPSALVGPAAHEPSPGGKAVKCPFCRNCFEDLDALKEHPVRCSHMKRFEPKQSCRHCSSQLPTSLTGLHQMVCKQNQDRISATRYNLNTEIFCPNCREPFFVKHMPKHLAKCMKHLQSILDNALSNESCSWNGQLGVDFIQTSGLEDWLKAPTNTYKRPYKRSKNSFNLVDILKRNK